MRLLVEKNHKTERAIAEAIEVYLNVHCRLIESGLVLNISFFLFFVRKINVLLRGCSGYSEP